MILTLRPSPSPDSIKNDGVSNYYSNASKQNMPLQYFLGDNQNAIRIQIWCALIADLLLQVVRQQVKRKWAFSNIVSLIRLHLFNYLNLFTFLENPDRCMISTLPRQQYQLKLNLSG